MQYIPWNRTWHVTISAAHEHVMQEKPAHQAYTWKPRAESNEVKV